MRKHLLSVLCPGLLLVSLHQFARAQGIVATHTSDGRLVYENAPEKTAQAKAADDTGLVYWSNRENRWKPVPPMYSHSRRAAQSAAVEVRRLIRNAALKNPRLAADGNALRAASEQVHGASRREQLPLPPTPAANAAPTSLIAKRQPGGAGQVPNGSEWIDNIVEQTALRHAVDPNLVRAIIQVESNFNPHAVSRKGAIGLMQLMPRTAKSLNVNNPYDPAQNVDAGVRHFKQLLDSYNGNLELSLAAYNAGVTAVHRSRGVPRYRETRTYVKRITGIYGSTTARLYTNGHPLVLKRDAEGRLSVSDIE
ncbi:MAG TPA: lytic transglycosylase domain-containing protein [Terriglobales bacterium]|nr:lytic transglycosylase domain-containing protein [Terriglobales bacterium]